MAKVRPIEGLRTALLHKNQDEEVKP
jgi:hypothetical protein